MIHHTGEGCAFKSGLNWAKTAGGFRLVWIMVDLNSYMVYGYYFRLRLHMRPFIIVKKSNWNLSGSFNHGTVTVSKEVWEDLLDQAHSRIKVEK